MERLETEVQNHGQEPGEEGVEIPLDRMAPDLLRNLISEFVSRDWDEGSTQVTLDDKIEQVHRLLKQNKARIVFDLTSNTANIVVRR